MKSKTLVGKDSLSSGVVLTGGGALLSGMTEIAEQVFDAPVRIGFPERDRFGGLIEDVQSPAWAAAAGLSLVASRTRKRLSCVPPWLDADPPAS